jgi:hypothetical protein
MDKYAKLALTVIAAALGIIAGRDLVAPSSRSTAARSANGWRTSYPTIWDQTALHAGDFLRRRRHCCEL